MTSRPRNGPAASMATRDATPRWRRSRWPTSSTDSMSRTRVETRARGRAVQALYAWDVRTNGGVPQGNAAAALDHVAAQIWDDLAVEPEERKLAGALLRTFQYHRGKIDLALTDVTTNWRLERLAVLDRCILRLGAAELERGETPPRVVIQEAVTLAERYSGVRSAKFVNGVLDALARKTGRLRR